MVDTTTTSAGMRSNRGDTNRFFDRLTPQTMVMPALLLVLATQILPGGIALFQSFRKVIYFQDRGFAGWSNYAVIFSDPQFWKSLELSIEYTLACVILGLLLALVSALAINRLGPKGTTLATFLLIPWALSQIVVALLARWILAPYKGGLLNAFLSIFGAGPVGLLNETLTALPTLVGVSVWRNFAFAAIILSAGLAQIPRNLYRASETDGATKWEEFRYITLPLLRPSLVISIVILTISYFNEVQLIIGLTEGGPAGATDTLAYYLYDRGVLRIENGVANAVAVVMFLINVALVALLVWVSGRASKVGSRAL